QRDRRVGLPWLSATTSRGRGITATANRRSAAALQPAAAARRTRRRMTALAQRETKAARNPLDIVEEIVTANEWSFQRSADGELSVEFPGHWCAYHLHFVWSEDLSAMHLSCFMDMKVPKKRFTPVAELLTLINTKLWLGAFVLPSEEATPVFRHTVL